MSDTLPVLPFMMKDIRQIEIDGWYERMDAILPYTLYWLKEYKMTFVISGMCIYQ